MTDADNAAPATDEPADNAEPAAPPNTEPAADNDQPAPAGDPDVIRRHLIVSGRVQGVFYRETLRRMAQEVGVAGWARNTRDGLEASLEGRRSDVESLVEWCRKGPPHAVVIHMQVAEEDPTGDSNFRVR